MGSIYRLAMRGALTAFAVMSFTVGSIAHTNTSDETLYWLKARAKDKVERSAIADAGVSIEITKDDYVIALGNKEQRNTLEQMGVLETSFVTNASHFDFPQKDTNFHNYDEVKAELDRLSSTYSQVTKLDSIGKSIEGRELFRLRISGDLSQADSRPGIIFMGAHHAREHLSVEVPLMLANAILEGYAKGDATMKRLVDTRDIHIIPMVNPDGAEYDISGNRYKMWRKNRSQNSDGTMGVDLNRNYGYKWGTGGSSSSGSSDTYMGPKPFSEPETQAVKALVEKHQNVTMLLSFHTFSELILYPWGHTYDPIADARDRSVFETMAKTMSKWNGYAPQASSDLYIASGDTTDWAYAEHKIFAFTFELDPSSMWDGGFYPGQAIIPGVFAKNLQPCLYLIDAADNPYKVTEPAQAAFGLKTPLIQ